MACIHCEISQEHVEELLLDREVIDGATNIFDALKDPLRFQILSYLLFDSKTPSDLQNSIGSSQSAISHALRLLRDRGLVSSQREGKYIWYALADEHIANLISVALQHASEPLSKE